MPSRRHLARERRRVAVDRSAAGAFVRAACRIVLLERPVIDVVHLEAVLLSGRVFVAGLHQNNYSRSAIGYRFGKLRGKERAEQVVGLRSQGPTRKSASEIFGEFAGLPTRSRERPGSSTRIRFGTRLAPSADLSLREAALRRSRSMVRIGCARATIVFEVALNSFACGCRRLGKAQLLADSAER